MTPSQQAPSLVERLNELSAWLSEHNIDMQMPVGMIDPAEAAARITELEGFAQGWHRAVETILTIADLSSALGAVEAVEAMRERLTRAERAEAQCRVLETAARAVEHAAPLLVCKAIREPSDGNGLEAWTAAIRALRQALSLSGRGEPAQKKHELEPAANYPENPDSSSQSQPSADAGPYQRSHESPRVIEKLPARDLTDAELTAEQTRVEKIWDEMHEPDEDGEIFAGHGGSPGEWLVERMDEIATEQARRSDGGRG